MKKILTLLFLICAFSVVAQNKVKVTGTVIDAADNSPLPGATILVKGTTQGTTTDFDGNYELEVSPNATLVVSYVGMATQDVAIKGRSNIQIALLPDEEMLDEVVAIGYGSIKKRDLTGAIVSVKGDIVSSTPSSSPVSGLQGKVAGLNIINTGAAGSTPTINIRGIGSLTQSSPYYVVDGMLTDNIDFVNPNDIETMEILKDASSLAMFGVKGANGIIIITTKKGQVGKTTVNYEGYAGIQTIMPMDKLKLTDASQFATLYNERLAYSKADFIQNNPGVIPGPEYDPYVPEVTGKGTDWLDEVTRAAWIQNHSLSFSNATEKSNTFFSLGFYDQQGVVKYDNYKRFTGRLNNDYKIYDWAKVGGNVGLSYWKKDVNSFMSYGDLLQKATRALPTFTPYDEDGSYNIADQNVQKDIGNPVADMEYGKDDGHSHGFRAAGNIFAEIYVMKMFTFRSAAYADISVNTDKIYKQIKPIFGTERSSSSYLNRQSAEYNTFQTENLLTFDKVIKERHRVKAMIGVTTTYSGSETFWASRDSIGDALFGDVDYVNKYLQMLSAGSALTMNNGDSKVEESQVSLLGRVNYSFMDRYILSATIRRDGSSKFAKDNRWGTFPSVGLGWIASEEEFIKQFSWIDFLKVKASWGHLGNDRAAGAYDQYLKLDASGNNYVVFGNQLINVPKISVFPDENLHWEVLKGYEAGFEFVTLNQKLRTELNLYYRETSDFITRIYVNSSLGEGLSITNAGSMVNKGIELTLNWQDRVGDFYYTVGGNFSYGGNKITSLGDGGKDLFNGVCITRVGETISSYYGLKTDGVFQNEAEIETYRNANGELIQPDARPGDFKFKDLNGDGQITNEDRTILGHFFAPFNFGLTFKGEYKGFDLSVEIAGVTGNQIYDQKKNPFSFTQFNFMESWMDRWHGEGTSDTYPILSDFRDGNGTYDPSDFYVESGSYIRLRSIQLGYTLPKNLISKIKLERCRVYFNAENFITLKSAKSWTPEVGGAPLEQGVDTGTLYPLPAVFTLGLNLTL